MDDLGVPPFMENPTWIYHKLPRHRRSQKVSCVSSAQLAITRRPVRIWQPKLPQPQLAQLHKGRSVADWRQVWWPHSAPSRRAPWRFQDSKCRAVTNPWCVPCSKTGEKFSTLRNNMKQLCWCLDPWAPVVPLTLSQKWECIGPAYLDQGCLAAPWTTETLTDQLQPDLPVTLETWE